MKSFFKSVRALLDIFFQSLNSVLLVLIFSKYPRSMAGIRRSEECLILGNGPSLRDDLRAHPSIVAGRDLLCVNDCVSTHLYEEIKPNLYLVLDPFYWMSDILPRLVPLRERLFKDFIQKTTWKITIFVPFEAKSSLAWCNSGLKENANITVHFINRTPVAGSKCLRNFFYRTNLGMPWAQNVLVAACFTAVNLGFKRIELLGADHSWHLDLAIDKDNLLYLKQKHFYDENEAKPELLYVSNSKPPMKMHELFSAWTKVFYGYMMVQEYAQSRQSQILNASSISFIDAFKRITLEKLER